MKLPRIHAEQPPARVRVTLPGDLKVALEAYAIYYREQYGDAVSLEALIPEMLTTFVSADREFRVWQQGQSESDLPPPSLPTPETARPKRVRSAASAAHTSADTANGVIDHAAEN